eukprot:3007664-Rhodomonas_salina.1
MRSASRTDSGFLFPSSATGAISGWCRGSTRLTVTVGFEASVIRAANTPPSRSVASSEESAMPRTICSAAAAGADASTEGEEAGCGKLRSRWTLREVRPKGESFAIV